MMKSLMPKSLVLQAQRVLDFVDGLLDPLTSYRLVLYFLYTLAGWAVLVAAFSHQIPFSWYDITLSILFLMAVCRGVNYLLSYSLDVPRNSESDFITALILSLIMSPAHSGHDFLILGLAGAFAMSVKYIIVIGRRHIFNPAATGAYLSGLIFHHYASWWVGTTILTPLVFIGGLLIMRKMKRYILVSFFMVVYLAIVAFDVATKQSVNLIWHNIWIVLTASPLLFFAYIMLIEPSTSPDKISKYTPYAGLVAILYGVTRLHVSPEAALLWGNVFAFAVAPYKRFKLKLETKRKEAEGIYSFFFDGRDQMKFTAGQYLEWTIPSSQSDGRGNRRYFTISSSPTEKALAFTVKIPSPASSFKNHLVDMKQNDILLASHLAGSFILPKNPSQKLAFLAGGVGITPFRSIIKDMIDSNKSRDAVLFYSANNPDEFAFKDLFAQAKHVGVKTAYSTGKLDGNLINQSIPDLSERLFYVSGPYGFVKVARQALIRLGLPRRNIVSDYFPGYG